MSSYQTRPAVLKDARAIAEIHVDAYTTACEGFVPAEHLAAMSVEKRQAYWREAIDLGEPQIIVATEANQVVGFIAFDRSRDKGTPPTMGELWAIHAAPASWGTGIGLALWDAARDGLREEGCTHVSVWVPLRDDRTLRFHELAGFKREPSSAKTLAVGGAKIEEIRLRRAVG